MNVYILLHAEVESKSHLKSFHRVLVLMTKRGLSQGPLPDPLPCSEACHRGHQRAVLSLRWRDGVDMDQDSRVPSDWSWCLSVGVVNLSPSTTFLLEQYSVPRLCGHCSEGKPGENTSLSEQDLGGSNSPPLPIELLQLKYFLVISLWPSHSTSNLCL